MSAPALTTVERLEGMLSDPVTKREAADLLEVGIASIYNSMRQFDAARIAGDLEAASRHIPCIHQGGVLQRNGTYKGGRYILPRDAFIRWYTSAGLDVEVIEQLYGKGAA